MFVRNSVNFADRLLALTDVFPKGYGFLADQLSRATLSIAANIAQCNGRFTKTDRKNFFGIARGSLQECIPLLELARRRELLEEKAHQELKCQLEQMTRMLSGLIRGVDKRKNGRKRRTQRCS